LKILFASLVAAAVIGAAGPVPAQSYPTRPVRIVVPFGPGSGTDIGTRILGQHLSAALGQPIVVENRPGAAGTTAATHVAEAAPDGYTLLMGTNSTHGANSVLQRNLPYDPLRSFVPIAPVGMFPAFLAVHPSIPANTPAELVAYARANPGVLTFATGNTTSLMMAEGFTRRLGIDAVRVAYPSNPPALTDVIGGRVSMMFPDIASSLPHVRSGRLRALAVVNLNARRSPAAPDLPTMDETVLPGLDIGVGWIGLFAPAGTPDAVVQRLAEEVSRIVATPEVREQLQRVGAEANPMTQAEFRAFVANAFERTTSFLREIGVQPE
jgi:tripartite-type tricarboxylate transporter receptor subunit TctC